MVTFSTSFKSYQSLAREFLAEFVGTFLLVFLGNNAVAANVLTDGVGGNMVTVYFGYGFGLFLGVLVSGNVSGGHLNPAVTVAGAVLKKFRWSKVSHYVVAQYCGAFIAACGTYALYADSFASYHIQNGVNQTTASIFATYPKEELTILGCFLDQILGSMVLVLAIYAITDPFNKVPCHLAPIYVALTLISIGCSLGINQGFAVNPARDLSPRLFTYLSCWGSDVFGSNSYWYATIVGPHVGAILGGGIYVFAVEKLRLVAEPVVASIESPPNKSNLCKSQLSFLSRKFTQDVTRK